MVRSVLMAIAFLTCAGPALADAGCSGGGVAAIAACTELIRRNPNDATAHNNRGYAHSRKGDDERAVADYTKAIELNPKYATAYNNRGRAYARKGDHERAMADYTKAIELNPKYEEAYTGRGAAYSRKGDHERAMADYTKAIELDPKYAAAYRSRGTAYARKGDDERAIADYTKAIELEPKYEEAYTSRGAAYSRRGDQERAFADYAKSIELDPNYAAAYSNRGVAYSRKGDNDRAITDYTKAIELNPKDAVAYNNRGTAYSRKGDNDRAITDYNKATELNPNHAATFTSRGNAHSARHDHDRAIPDYTKAIELDPKSAWAHHNRGKAHEAKGRTELAIADFRSALALPDNSPSPGQAHAEATQRLAAIQSRKQAQDPSAAKPSEPTTGRRVALVIANSNYASVGRLPNAGNDGRALAASLRRIGFAEVVERYDLNYSAMVLALREFGDRVADADWAVVYFAGHGVEMNGSTYLIPVDAKLERDTHVPDETVMLTRVLEKVESAKRLRLVILDACRNNPFISRMVRSSASRSIGRGLSQIEPDGGVLVAYAARHGTTAEDGTGSNSPFAEALLARLEEPGLEIGFLFRRVRDDVMTKTNKRQEPWLYGSLPGENLFFRHAEAR